MRRNIMGDILKEAIADAKAVRETALQNAKMALEEAFTPQLKSMLSAKLKEEDLEEGEFNEGEHEDDDETEEGRHDEGEHDDEAEEGRMSDGEDDAEEGMHDEDMDDDDVEEGVVEINGVKYAPVVSEDEDEDEAEEGSMREDDDEEEVDESNLDLEAVIKELESELSEQDDAYDEKASASRDGLAEEDDAYDEKASASRDGLAEGEDDDTVDEEYEIDEAALEEEEELEEVDKSSGIGSGDNSVADTDKSSGIGSGDNSLKEELEEYKEAVKFLKDKLHEVNILNAKLLFTNKLFKEFALDNNQKLRVVETFDRAQSTREIKLVYSTLAEQFGDNGSINRKSINESASSKTGSTKPSKESRKVISEEAQVANRFKKLAGLIK